MSRIVNEATLALAPERARQALATTTAAIRMYGLLYDGRKPSDEAQMQRFILESHDLGCTAEEIKWLVDAALIAPAILDLWKEQTDAHA